MRLWQTYGYDAVSINRICAECGVTKGSFYHHFESKEDVIDWYVGRKMQKEQRSIEADNMTERLAAILQNLTEPVMELNPDILMVLIGRRRNEMPGAFNSLFVNTVMYQDMLESIREGQKRGEFRNDHSGEELLRTILSVFTGNIVLWCLNEKNFDLLEEDRRILELLLKTK